ncbi:hypothetical protein [Streptomyces sp. NPDC056544]|uniref:hypothetical protein n=1 Tax=unclassified Streptomyces TaxID=2593676 RepID=UPI0036B84E71
MRVKLRPSTVYGAYSEGVFVQTPRGAFTLRLPAPLAEPACAWIRALEQPRTTADLVDAAGNPKAAPFIERVIAQMRAQGALIDAYEAPPGLPEEAVAYVESYSDDPAAALRALAAAEVSVGAAWPQAATVEAALVARGVRVRLVGGTEEGDRGACGAAAVTGPGLAVRVEAAGGRTWVVSSALAAAPAALAALRDRLTTGTSAAGAPPVPDAAAAELAARLAAQIAAEQAFKEITGLVGRGSRTVHVVDSRPLGWRSLDLTDDGDADGPDAAALIGRYRTDTPADWAQLPVCLARVVPGPGTPDGRAAAGWGATGGEADDAALRAFLRGPDPEGGAGTTEGAALLDAALRLAALDRQADGRVPWQEGDAGRTAPPGASWRYRLHEAPGGLVCAEAALVLPVGSEGGRAGGAAGRPAAWHGTAWGRDRTAASEAARAAARARAQLAGHDPELAGALGPDCRIAEELAASVRPHELAAELLGHGVGFRPAAHDPLLGAHPLVHGTLVRDARGDR